MPTVLLLLLLLCVNAPSLSLARLNDGDTRDLSRSAQPPSLVSRAQRGPGCTDADWALIEALLHSIVQVCNRGLQGTAHRLEQREAFAAFAFEEIYGEGGHRTGRARAVVRNRFLALRAEAQDVPTLGQVEVICQHLPIGHCADQEAIMRILDNAILLCPEFWNQLHVPLTPRDHFTRLTYLVLALSMTEWPAQRLVYPLEDHPLQRDDANGIGSNVYRFLDYATALFLAPPIEPQHN